MRKYDHTLGNGSAATTAEAPPLQAGDRLTRVEFLFALDEKLTAGLKEPKRDRTLKR